MKLHQRRRQPAVDVDQEPATVTFATQRRSTQRRPVRRVAPKPVTSYNVLDDVHTQVADDVRAVLKKHRLDYRAVKILSPAQVEIAIP